MSLVGRLEDLALPDIFQILSLGKKSGCLVVSSDDKSAGIIFENGLVVRCEADFLERGIGQDLVEAGSIFTQDLDRARARVTESGSSLGETILSMGLVDQETLQQVARQRVERIVFHLLKLERGDFRFELDLETFADTNLETDAGVRLTRGMSPEFLLMEGARVDDEERRGRGEVPVESRPREEVSEAFEDTDDWGADDLWEDASGMREERGAISSLRALSAELRFPSSTSEITLLILRFASDIFQRGVLFMVGREELVGLGQFGLDVDDADGQVRKIRLGLGQSDFFRQRIEERLHFQGPLDKDSETEALTNGIGGGWPETVDIFPVVAEERVVVLLYCDNLPSGQPLGNWEGLEVFAHQAGLAVEKALLERKLRKYQDNAQGM